MGCTPSIHVSQTGVVYCREQDETRPPDTVKDISHRSSLQRSNSRSPGKDDAPSITSDVREGHVKGLRVTWSESDNGIGRENHKGQLTDALFGPVFLQPRAMAILLVFGREDRQSNGFWAAAEKLGYSCTMASTADMAIETYLAHRHHVVIVDARKDSSLNHISLASSIKSQLWSDLSVLVAVTDARSKDEPEPSIEPLLKAGYTRRFPENPNVTSCMNDLLGLEHGEVKVRHQLQACAGLQVALDNISEAVEVTDGQHNIQFVNHAYERHTGYSREELLGRDSRELFKSEKNRDISDSLQSHVSKGKRWEGTFYTRRKSGDTVPFHCKVFPLPGPAGVVNQCVTVRSHFTDGHVANGNMVSFPKRRESVVRAHSMTIEAPITKVINIINAAQENSPLTVAQALEKVLEILQTSELYSPFQSQDMRPDNDPVTSDLVDGLMSQNVKRKLSAHDMQRQAISSSSPASPATCLAQLPPEILTALEHDSAWDFDIIALEKLTNKRPLLHLGLKIFARFGVCEYLNIPETCLVNWLTLMESTYHARNFYHNSTHAADVLHATAYFLDRERSKEIFDIQDQISCLIAAAVHDVDHPARTNAFLINEKHQLAILYNDQAVLENHHASTCFRLTHKDRNVDIFKNLGSDDYKAIRQSIIDQVLATDMKQHFEHLSKFTTSITKHLQRFEEDNTDEDTLEPDLTTLLTDLSTFENKGLVKRMMIKCADVSNPLRPLALCKEWAYRIAEEYCQQTDEEKSRGLPVVMAQFDRKVLNIAKCQVAFVNLFITNMFDAWDVFCDVPELMQHLQINFDYWNGLQDQDSQERRASGADNS